MTLKVGLNRRVIQLAMLRRNMSQNMLAMKLGISSGYISQLMRGVRNASPGVRQKMLEVFSPMSFDELFVIKDGGDGDGSHPE